MFPFFKTLTRLTTFGITIGLATSASANSDVDEIDTGSYIQKLNNFSLHENYTPLTLDRVIEQGLRKNFDQQKKTATKQILELALENIKHDFWYPNINLVFSTNTWSDYWHNSYNHYPYSYRYYGVDGHVVETLRSKSSGTGVTTPNGYFGLVMNDYTIFNWGKDYLAYTIEKESLTREKESIEEHKRSFRHHLITKFFELSYRKNIVNIRKEMLRHASFVYRLNKEKLALQKITRQEFYQGRSEYLKAQELFQDAKISSDISDEEMTSLIADPSGTRYIIRHNLQYIPLQITLSDALLVAEKNNSGITDANVGLENAKRAHQIQQKNNLPLPTFSVHLGAYGHRFGNDASTTEYTNFNNNNDLEVVASINATWSILGSGGFLNGRYTEMTALNQYIALKQLEQSKHNASSDVMIYFTKAKYSENMVTVLTAKSNTSQKNFDTTLENYMQKRTGFIELKDALDEMTDTKEKLELAKYEHEANKLLLATTIGLDDFPGDNFEGHIAKDGSNE